MLNQIKSVADVEYFARLLVEEGANFHPDNDFLEFVNFETGEPTYTSEEAELRNMLMERAFEVCEKEEKDIYSVMQRIMMIETGMDQFITLS